MDQAASTTGNVPEPAMAEFPSGHPRVAPPLLPAAAISRERLLARLDRARDVPLISVTAPSGSGKTFLVAGWAARQDGRVAWLSVDPGDGDLRAFAGAVVSAVRRVDPGAMARSAAMLRTPEMPDPAAAGDVLASDLAAVAGELTLVLDDVHLIAARPSEAALARLLLHPVPGLHLVLVSRGRLTETLRQAAPAVIEAIGDADLRLTPEEAGALAASTVAPDLPAEAIAELHERAEGWTAGMMLLLLGQRHADPGREPVGAADGEREFAELLIGRVLASQPEPLQELLLAVSVVDRVEPGLADALLGREVGDGASRALLDHLADHQVFTTRTEGRWFRLHALFRAALLGELERRRGREAVDNLRRRAAAWLGARGLVDEALDQALAAGDEAIAADLVAAHAEAALVEGRQAAVARWIGRLSPTTLAARPRLAAWQAWADFHRNDFAGGIAATDRLERALAAAGVRLGDAERDALSSEVDALRGHAAGWFGDNPTSLKRLGEAIRRLPPDHRIARISALTDYAASIYARGDLAGGLALVTDGLADPQLPPAAELQFGMARWYLHYVSAQLPAAEEAGRDQLRRALRSGNLPSQAQAHLAVGIARYERDDLPQAIEHFSRALALREHAPPIVELDASIGLALSHQAAGDPDAARAAIDAQIADLHRLGGSAWLPLAESFRARLALRQGDPGRAVAWLIGAGDRLDQPASSTLERTRLTQAKVLLALGTPEHLAAAGDVLRQQLREASDLRMVQRGLRTRVLLALVLDAQGDPAAVPLIRDVLAEAAPAGYTRLFLDLGPAMEGLIRRASRSASSLALLSRFEADRQQPEHPTRSGPALSPEAAEVAASLTPREMQLLLALDRFATNKEIGAELGIATPTVKRHATRLFAKLGVGSRREAVVAARQLGLIQPPSAGN